MVDKQPSKLIFLETKNQNVSYLSPNNLPHVLCSYLGKQMGWLVFKSLLYNLKGSFCFETFSN